MKDVGERESSRAISVIIPAYNIEKYIDQCLDSLQAQTFDDFEVICVDDGSDDRTRERIREHIKKDQRIRLIEMPHCGLAGAMRNTGIENADGKYCLFLDGDDFFEPDMLKKSYEKAEEDDADICLFDARLYNEKTKVYKEIDYIIQKEYLPAEIPFEGRKMPYTLNITTGCPWSKLIRRDLIDEYQLRFMLLPRSNDIYFIFMAMALAKRITVVPEVFVNYRQSGESLQANNAKSPWNWYEAVKSIRNELEKQGIYKDLECSFRNMAFGIAIYNLCSLKSAETYCEVYEGLRNKVFQEFDLKNFSKEECYSYNKKKYEIYENILKYDVQQYLFEEIKKLKQEKSYWVKRAKNAEKKENMYITQKAGKALRKVGKIFRMSE